MGQGREGMSAECYGKLIENALFIKWVKQSACHWDYGFHYLSWGLSCVLQFGFK